MIVFYIDLLTIQYPLTKYYTHKKVFLMYDVQIFFLFGLDYGMGSCIRFLNIITDDNFTFLEIADPSPEMEIIHYVDDQLTYQLHRQIYKM